MPACPWPADRQVPEKLDLRRASPTKPDPGEQYAATWPDPHKTASNPTRQHGHTLPQIVRLDNHSFARAASPLSRARWPGLESLEGPATPQPPADPRWLDKSGCESALGGCGVFLCQACLRAGLEVYNLQVHTPITLPFI